MNYKEIRIDTIRDVLLHVCGIYTTVCRRDDLAHLDTNAANPEMMRSLVCADETLCASIAGTSLLSDKLYFYTNDLDMVWMLALDADRVYLLGPAFTDNYSMIDVLDKMDSYLPLGHGKTENKAMLRDIPVVSALRMNQYGMMFYCALTGEAHSLDAIQWINSDPVKSENALPQPHGTNYVLEQKLWNMVKEGNMNYRQEMESILVNITPAKVSGGRPMRREKNMAIVQVTLTCRAAIEGGLHPEIAFPLSDLYIRRIEDCQSSTQLQETSVEILDDYIRRVHQIKVHSGISAQIMTCCSQISLHPEETPDLEQLAKKYGYTPYYFSRKFKQETGMSLRDYAIRQKIEKAKHLLTENTMSISDISEYLGFTSQSYFGSVFRKFTGTTPSKYQQGYSEGREDA